MSGKMTTQKRRIRQSPKMPAELRREQLLKAANDLFVKKGYRATTLDEIAQKAGLTKGAIYFHFKNKESILGELVKTVSQAYEKGINTYLGKNHTPVELFQLLLEIDSKIPMPEARRNPGLLSEIMKLPRIRTQMRDAFNKSVDKLSDALDSRFGRTVKQRRSLVIMLIAYLNGLKFVSTYHSESVDFEKQTELFLKLFQATYGDNPGEK